MAHERPLFSKNVQGLDDLDKRILKLLARDGRMPNAAIAEACGVAASTCLLRLRQLRERGVIRRYVADIDPAALGRPIQALVAIRLQPDARPRIPQFAEFLANLPGVLNVYFLAGANDFQVHISARDTHDLQDLVVNHLSNSPDVGLTETNLIFEHTTRPSL
jgi:DNA-binding Lrp family transcriptional regulator